METQIFNHPSIAGIQYNNNDKKIYCLNDNNEYIPAEIINLVATRTSKGFVYNGKSASLYRSIYECFNNTLINDKGLIVTYRDTLTIPEDFDPNDLILMAKGDWLEARYKNGSMDATKAKVYNYLKAHAKEWTNKAVVNTDTGEEFSSAKEASISLNMSATAVAHGIRYDHIVGGFHWRYKDDAVQSKIEERRKTLKPLKWQTRPKRIPKVIIGSSTEV